MEKSHLVNNSPRNTEHKYSVNPKQVWSYHRSILATSNKKEIQLMRGKLLCKLPIYKEKHIQSSGSRDVGTEQHGSVLDLVEQGFFESAEFLRKLLDFEVKYRSTPDNVADSNNWPWLSKTDVLLNVLVSSLREAELAGRNGKRLLQIAAWFHISVFTALRKNCWYWLSDFLFKQCLNVTKLLRTGVKREASVRFTYAQFLSEKLNLQIEALRHFNIVRRMTRSRRLEGLDLLHINEFNSDLHSQSCYFMNKVCLQIARTLRDKNPSITVKLCQKAYEFIETACIRLADNIPYCPERDAAVFELVLSLITSHEYATAISKLNAILKRSREVFNAKGFCKALYFRAKCYEHINKRSLAITDLKLLCQISKKCGFDDLSVLGELEYAELLLSLGSKSPLETLRNAAYAFLTAHNDPDRDVRQRARCLIGIAEGLFVWPHYKEMIVASQENKDSLKKLIEWKFCREPFMENQIQAFAVQIPKRGAQTSSDYGLQIQKFVLPEKFAEILGEPFRSNRYSHNAIHM